jgi:hypothetical protein
VLKVGDLVVHVPYGHETVHLLYEALGHSSDFDVGWYQYGEIEKIRE